MEKTSETFEITNESELSEEIAGMMPGMPEISEPPKSLESSETLDSTDVKRASPADKAVGNMYCEYINNTGAKQRWRLSSFDLRTIYDERRRLWYSNGYAFSDYPQRYYPMTITYDVSKRSLTFSLDGWVFTMDDSQGRVSNYNDRSTLDIVFYKDVEGYHPLGSHYTIKNNARLSISL
jgi:hypothetical protein